MINCRGSWNQILNNCVIYKLLKMKLLTWFVFLSASFASQGQRVAVDFNTALDNGFVTLVYCHIVKPGWYVKGGFSTGNYGRSEHIEDVSEVQKGAAVVSPYTSINTANPGMKLFGYNSRRRGSAIELGIGKFFELGPIHTIRFDIQLKGYRITEDIFAGYVMEAPGTVQRGLRVGYKRSGLSFGPEIFHAIRLTGRLTFYYGVKIPYFLPLRTVGYHPWKIKSPSTGIQPNLAIGLSYAISRKTKED